MRLNVLLIGEEAAGIQMLKALARSEHRVVAVLSSPSSSANRGTRLWDVAQAMDYPTMPARLVKQPDFAMWIKDAAVDLLLNVHSLYVICKEVLDAPRIGSFNLHPGPLPCYAGLNAASWAIYHDEPAHGVTVHRMEAEIDAGTIAYQATFPVAPDDTGLSLSAKCARAGVPLMTTLVQTAALDPRAIPLIPQDLSHRSYFGREVPNGGRIAWSWTAREVVNFVRACDYFPFPSPWGDAQTLLRGQDIAILKAFRTGIATTAVPGTIGQVSGTGIEVACADEWISVSKIKVENRRMKAAGVLVPGERFDVGG